MRTHVGWIAVVALLAATSGCAPQSEPETTIYEHAEEIGLPGMATYTTVRLTADMSHLSDNQRKMIPLLIEAASSMDDAFWIQAYGDKQELQSSIADEAVRRYTDVNYGPWSRLNDNEPFIEGVGPKPDGANVYRVD
ncbi:MAG: dipeptidyl-peptidase 3 family protein, partial [Planctomycetota bacterium]